MVDIEDRFRVRLFSIVYRSLKENHNRLQRFVDALVMTADHRIDITNPVVKEQYEEWCRKFGDKRGRFKGTGIKKDG